MIITEKFLPETLTALVKGIAAAQKSLCAAGISIDFPEDVTVKFVFVTADGVNAVVREQTEDAGQKVQTEAKPEVIETSAEGEKVAVSVATGHTLTSTERTVGQPSTSTSTKGAQTNTSTRVSDPATSTRTTVSETSQTQDDAKRGSDMVKTDYEVKAT